MPNTRNIKATLGIEVTPGVAVSPTSVIPINSMPTLTRKINRKSSDVIMGTTMINSVYATDADVSGSISLRPEAVAGLGKPIKLALGAESTNQIGAILKITYTGANASCKLVADSIGKTLKSYVGVLGAETLDATFGTSGSLDLTNTSYNTPAKLVTTINGYAGYNAVLINGDGAVNSNLIVSGTYQAAKKEAYFYFTSITSTVYAHKLTPVLDSTERDSATIQIDGLGDNLVYAGCYVKGFSLSGSAKGELEGSLDIVGMTETGGAGASGLSLPNSIPLTIANASVTIDGASYQFRKFDLKVENNSNKDVGYKDGSLDTSKVVKGNFDVSGTITVLNDTQAQALKAKWQNGTQMTVAIRCKGALLGSSLYESLYIEIPFCVLDGFNIADESSQITNSVPFKAINPSGTVYDAPLTITVIDQTASYAS